MKEPKIKGTAEKIGFNDILGDSYKRLNTIQRYVEEMGVIDKDRPHSNIPYHTASLIKHNICQLRNQLIGKDFMEHLWKGTDGKDVCEKLTEELEEGGFLR
ncbi:hypothetical protein LCGC14_1488900 [marine sediment metagenome]|uniref:Uncharacterized protein n=2 Tax=marine sediment metagenome TaxID=412755 RepID=A0A0F9JT77_9ZZZZ